MKNKIFRLAKGDFLTENPDIVLDTSRISFRVGEGDVYEGCLTLKDKKGGKVRGLVYSSLIRLELMTQGFDSAAPEIAFKFDASGLKPGHTVTGRLTVVTNGGEYIVPVTAIIEKPYVLSSVGKIRNLDEFAYLAYKDFGEAHEIFKSRDFRRIVRYEAPFVRALYEKMRTWSLTESALEEFLVATKKKERLNISLSDSNKLYNHLPETGGDEVILFKNDWGGLSVRVIPEGDFIVPEKTLYGREDFCGNTLRIGYDIDPKKLHIGKNYGRLRISTFYEEKILNICVKNGERTADHSYEKTLAGILHGFIRAEAGEMTDMEFFDKAERKLITLRDRVPQKRMTELYLAKLYILMGKNLDSEDILNHFIWRREELKREPLLGIYHNYLLYQTDKGDRQREKLIGMLNKYLKKAPLNEKASLWLMNVDPRYERAETRAELLKKLGDQGAHSIMFLYEAWRLYEENPDLLVAMGPFEKRVLRFAVHYHLGGPFFLARAVFLGGRQTSYDPGLARILKALYDLAEPELQGEILPVLTSQFIKGNIITPWAHEFYSAAVERGHMMARLYEFYMMTLADRALDEQLPREVYLYFSYGDGLPESKKALLYASVLLHVSPEDPVRSAYRERIRAFAEEQLLLRHISEPLRVIYRNVLAEVELNLKELKALRDICHVYEVTTSMPGMKYILVLDGEGNITEKVPVKQGGRSQVVLNDPDNRIVWEGMNGWHYADSFPFDIVRMFYETAFIDRVRVIDREEKPEETVLPVTRQEILVSGPENFTLRELYGFFEDNCQPDADKEDVLMTAVGGRLYRKGVRGRKMLIYLGKWFTGPTDEMVSVWKDVCKENLDGTILAEKIITQMLFSGQIAAEHEIFMDYYRGQTVMAIMRAYLVSVSADYLINDRVIPDEYFKVLRKEMSVKQPLPMVCRLAYLKYATSKGVSEDESFLRGIFRDAVLEEIIFPFFMHLPSQWLREMGISDKIILMYQGQSGGEVSVHTAITDENAVPEAFEKEVLTPMWKNQYVAVLTVYSGEKLTWYFEENDTQTDIKSHIKRQGSGRGRYSALSRMLTSSEEEKEKLLMDYYTEEKLAEHFFGGIFGEEASDR